jgi:hypothetical protein
MSDCEVVGSELRVCNGWNNNYTEQQREICLMAALLVNGVTTNRGALVVGHGDYTDDDENAELVKNAYNIANWVKRRFAKYDWETRDPNIFWDARPDKSYLPLFEARLPRVYHVWPKSAIDHTQLRRAWDHSWCYAEAAFRFLYKLTYMTELQIICMWNFGTGLDPASSVRFFSEERQRELIVDPNREVPPVAFSSSSVPSMRNFFGVYSKRRFLTVYRVVLCLCLRYENNYDRGNTHLQQKFRLYPGTGKGYGALSFPTGEVDLHKKWFDSDEDEYRAYTINHELMHYLIRWDGGGRPRDWKSPSLCSTTEGSKCYSIEECLALAAADDDRAHANNNNYAFWFLTRWQRWGGDWPPENAAGPNNDEWQPDGIWHNDPIEDMDWGNHTYGSVAEIGWERLDVMEDRFGLPGFMPW